MACIEACGCGHDPECTMCGGKGVIVEDAMVWGARKGFNDLPDAFPSEHQVDTNIRQSTAPKGNIFSKLYNLLKKELSMECAVFDFAVEKNDGEEISKVESDELMDAFIRVVEARGMSLGGSYGEFQEEEGVTSGDKKD